MAINLSTSLSFQSTPSARRATSVWETGCEIVVISIHALREEGDASPSWCWPSRANFNPRPPRGGRHSTQRLKLASSLFQSTPSAGRATSSSAPAPCPDGNFNPRPPRGERRGSSFAVDSALSFQSTPSARRATLLCFLRALAKGISIHALREESDCPALRTITGTLPFQSTPSARRAT